MKDVDLLESLRLLDQDSPVRRVAVCQNLLSVPEQT